MSSHRVLLLEGCLHLAIDTGRLVIRSRSGEQSYIAPSDIAVLVVDHPDITVTSAALKALLAAQCTVIVTDEKHLPLAQAVPFSAPTRAGLRLRQQLELERSTRAQLLWRELVVARILSESGVLRSLQCKGVLYLERLAKKVEPADTSNHEAQAARHYWKHLLPDGFRRVKQGAEDGINARLNYGYAVIRSLIARSLVSAGLQPCIGLGHYREDNPFNLADDFMEPYRFVVEQHVMEQVALQPEAAFDANARKRVAACASRDVRMAGQVYRLPAAVEETVESFTRLLDNPDLQNQRLVVPEALA